MNWKGSASSLVTKRCIQIGSRRISQCFQKLFRHFVAFRAIEIITEFLFVGTAVASPYASFSNHLTAATGLLHTTDQESVWD
jgi:hypothetical protein